MRRTESIQPTPETRRALALDLPASVRDCIEACNDTHQACEQAILHCLEQGGEFAEVSHMRLLQDCSQATAMAADFMQRESGFHARLCLLCADVCLAAAANCEKLGAEDDLLAATAVALRGCAERCKCSSRQH